MGAILLVRHGQASFGAAEYDALSDLGVQQATLLGKTLRTPFQLVVRGSMKRHEQTAAACGHSGAESDPAWNEYDHEAVLAAHAPNYREQLARAADPRRAFQAIFAAAVARWASGADGYGETYAAFRARALAAVTQLAGRLGKGQSAIVFTSGGPVSAIVSHLLGVPDARALELQWTLVNCGVTKLLARGTELGVSSVNEHAWMAPELVTYR